MDGKKGIAVLKADQSDLIAMIDTPWAKDGSGKDIETYYEIKGNTIVQIVKHKVKGTVYPVTADPWWQWRSGGGFYKFNKPETHFIGIAGNIVAIVGGVPMVAANPYIAAVFAGYNAGLAAAANEAEHRNQCLGVSIFYYGVWFWPYHDHYCKGRY